MHKDLLQWNISADEIAKVLDKKETETFGVYEENWPVFNVFWVVKDQWNVVPGLKQLYYQSINLPAIESACNLLKVEDAKAILEGLMVMESAAKEVLNQSVD